MWESLLKRMPGLIRLVKKDRTNFEDLLELAVEHGYVPSASDLRSSYEISDYVAKNSELLDKVLKKNPRAIVSMDFPDDKIIQKAINMGYKPRLKDIKHDKSWCSWRAWKNGKRNIKR